MFSEVYHNFQNLMIHRYSAGFCRCTNPSVRRLISIELSANSKSYQIEAFVWCHFAFFPSSNSWIYSYKGKLGWVNFSILASMGHRCSPWFKGSGVRSPKKSWICLNGPQVESSCSIEGSCLEKSTHPTVYFVGRVVANY